MSINAAADMELAIAAARAAGVVVMKAFRTDQEVTYKSADQPLTPADLEADALLKRMLLRDRPDYGWLSEETADTTERLGKEDVWVVDPIDGTRSYISGRAEFAISVGLAQRGEAVLGVVYNPATDELYTTVRGHGARRGSESIAAATTNRRPIIAASRSEIARGEFDAFRDEFDLLPTGSTAYKLGKVADGSADVFLSRGPKSEWDVCAGALIVEEAGGVVSQIDGVPLHYNKDQPHINGVIAARRSLHADMVRRIRELS